jgi:pyruvate kinase
MERRRTKIVATLGPASESPAVLRAMIDAGVDVVRLGLAHGPVEDHLERVRDVRRAAADAGRVVAVLADLPGPKIRAGAFPEGGVVLLEGQELRLVVDGGRSDAGRISVHGLPGMAGLEAGDVVTMGDGAVMLTVMGADADSASVVVRNGGRLQGSPGVHVPSDRLELRAPTEDDLRLIEALRPAAVDIVAVSFVRRPDDITTVADRLGTRGRPLVMAKIETPAAVAAHHEILEVADAVMVARGDLGVECPIEDLPHLQKRLIRDAVAFGRPVVTATQMLESMIHAPTPTRAEASDVANAVLDGTDALMLSGETAIGRNPVAAVATMARIALRAEQELEHQDLPAPRGGRLRLTGTTRDIDLTDAVCEAAWEAADSVGAAAIVCCTATGDTARAMARLRPGAPLVAVTPSERVARALAVTWGAVPIVAEAAHTTDELVHVAVRATRRAGWLAAGDVAAVLAGRPDDARPTTDVLRLVQVR